MSSKLKNNICCSARYVQQLHFRVKLIAKLLTKVRDLTFFFFFLLIISTFVLLWNSSTKIHFV